MLQGEPRCAVHVLDASDMFVYDRQSCWQVHEPVVIAALQLKTSYPVDEIPCSCCRCGRSVERRLPHVSYVVLCMHVSFSATGGVADVLSDEELAVLCPDCEDPEWVTMAQAAQAVTAISPLQMESQDVDFLTR